MPIEPTKLNSNVDPELLLRRILSASTSNAVEEILATLPIRNEQEYTFNSDDNKQDWKQGMLHWFPVGGQAKSTTFGRSEPAAEAAPPAAELRERACRGSSAAALHTGKWRPLR